jgi:hypothetical protein
MCKVKRSSVLSNKFLPLTILVFDYDTAQKGKYWYGESADDVRTELVRFSRENGYEATRFSTSLCGCGGRAFKLETDEEAGAHEFDTLRRQITSLSNKKRTWKRNLNLLWWHVSRVQV